MSNELFNDDILLDRLVDGELTDAERRGLLESLDKRPEGWRRCALAFLEAQSWRKELGHVAHVSHQAAMPALSARTTQKPQWLIGIRWLALAAGLLLAFRLGWIERQRAAPAGGAISGSGQIASVAPQGAAASPKAAQDREALTLYVRDEAGKMQAVRVPLVDAGTLDEQFGVKFQTGLSDALRNQLTDRGYDIQSKRQYAPLWLGKPNGQPMIVPVEDTRIVPKVY